METKKQRVHQHAMMCMAVDMIKRGFTTTIVNIETGISLNTIRELFWEIHNSRPTSGQLPQSSHLMRSTNMQKQVSLYLALYESFGGKGVYKNIDIRSLFLAHDHYALARTEIKEFRNLKEAEIIKPSEGWVLARDLRSKEFELLDCSCGCRVVKYDYPMIRQCCPFCESRYDSWFTGRKSVIDREEARLKRSGPIDIALHTSISGDEGVLLDSIPGVAHTEGHIRVFAGARMGRGKRRRYG